MGKLNTPWGQADQVDKIGDRGILHVSTPSHGGFYVPDELLALMPIQLQGSNSYSGRGNWFEEDCEWAIPVLAFPAEFPADYCKAAVETANCYAKNKGTGLYFDSVVQWLEGTAGDAVKIRAGLPIVGSSNINTCFGGLFDHAGVEGPDGMIYSDADPGL